MSNKIILNNNDHPLKYYNITILNGEIMIDRIINHDEQWSWLVILVDQIVDHSNQIDDRSWSQYPSYICKPNLPTTK